MIECLGTPTIATRERILRTVDADDSIRIEAKILVKKVQLELATAYALRTGL